MELLKDNMKIRKIGILMTTLCLSTISSLVGCGDTSDKTSCDDLFGCTTTTTNNNPYLSSLNLLDESNNFSYKIDDTVDNSKSSANYELFVRTFYDSNGDGTGDLRGVIAKLPYLASLGIKNIWLMPINPSNSYHGYDITDYFDIESDYGTLADFSLLIAEANKLNIGIYLDLVINHSSSENQYFKDSYRDLVEDNTSPTSKKDWYHWGTSGGTGWNKKGDYYYESVFSPNMPDFNLDSPAVREEIKNIVKFWIEKGISGFRLDAVPHYYGENEGLNKSFLGWLKDTVNSINNKIELVGEAWIISASSLVSYYTSKCDSFFAFPFSRDGTVETGFMNVAGGYSKPDKFLSQIVDYEASIRKNSATGYASYFIDNHDMDRSSLTGDKAKLSFSLLELMPGDTWLYYGDEIGLKGKRGSEQTDAMRRLPMIWSEKDKTGETKIPDKSISNIKYDQVKLGVDDLENINDSLLNHVKKAINIRNKYSFIAKSQITNLTSKLLTYENNVALYKLTGSDSQSIIIATNTSSNDTVINVKDIATKIVDSINTTKKGPTLVSDLLSIGAYSTVILQ